jgi:hypothetical protein
MERFGNRALHFSAFSIQPLAFVSAVGWGNEPYFIAAREIDFPQVVAQTGNLGFESASSFYRNLYTPPKPTTPWPTTVP